MIATVSRKNRSNLSFARWGDQALTVRVSMKMRLLLFLIFSVFVTWPIGDGADARDPFVYFKFHDPFKPCAGDCAIALYGGRSTSTSNLTAFGLNDFKPVWNWEWDDTYFVAVSVSRRIVSGGGRWFGDTSSIETEFGIGKRFGTARELEVWFALVGRWSKFPWNRYVYTTIAATTGLSYATGSPELERALSDGKGSRLMHFFSPEITFAHPRRKEIELVLRYHHRSGLFQVQVFNGTTAGMTYFTAGFRVRF
jgi:hypothetical protein